VAETRIKVDIPIDVPPEEFISILEDTIEEAIILYKLRSNLGKTSPDKAEELLREVREGIREKVRRLLNETRNRH